MKKTRAGGMVGKAGRGVYWLGGVPPFRGRVALRSPHDPRSAMLECDSLFLSLDPEAQRMPGPVRRVLIRAAASGEPLGWALLGCEPRPFWFPWPAARVLAVHEHHDAPLLFTARRSWPLPVWLVRDADGRPVGSVVGTRLRDRQGRVISGAPLAREEGWTFRDPSGKELGRLQPNGERLRLDFGAPAGAEPFGKMLLLAFALTRRGGPAARAPGRG